MEDHRTGVWWSRLICFVLETIVVGHFFLIETDHRNLTFIHSGTSAKVSRWSLALQGLPHAVSHCPGEKMTP